jgi:hypothetical protein
MFTRTLTLKGITASFSKTIEDLKSLLSQNETERADNSAEINALAARNNEISVENAQAEKILSNISALIGETPQ